jgi:PAS domain S-box-containing protein
MIAEILDYAIILLDLDGTILTWNKGAQAIKGYKANEILGQNFRIFYLPRDREEKLPEKLIDLAIQEGRARHIGKRVRKDGTTFWGSILITALHDDDGEVIGFTKLTKELGENEID